jgi:stearoyl-CoA desaturase (delta-9 desaturase)
MKKLNFIYIGFVVLPIFALAITGLTLMVMSSSYIWLISTFVMWILMSGLGIAVGFHRVYSHRCYVLKSWLDVIVLFFGTMACQMSSITWVSIHMGYHHPFSDTEKDPHTPKKGWWNAFLGWTIVTDPNSINLRYAAKLLRSKLHIFFHKHYLKILWISIFLSFLLFGWQFTLIGYAVAAMISILQDNLVNLLGHSPSLGYRNFETKDISSNFIPLGYLGWGQGWHNNHHQYPARFNFGVKWWEYDPCRIFIPLLKAGSIKK